MPSSGSGSAATAIGTGYPTEADLIAYLTGAGFSSALIAAVDTATAVAAGATQYEKDVRRKMLAGTSATRYYDPPMNRKRILFLSDGGGPGDLIGTITVAYQPVGQATATTYVSGTDYRLLPRNAAADGIPYDRIEFYHRYWSDPQPASLRGSLQVTGQWGYNATTIPELAWLGMLAAGAIWLLPSMQQALTGGLTGWKENDVSEDHSPLFWKATAEGWMGTYRQAVAAYQKQVLA